MIAYKYNVVTKEFMGIQEAQLDPLETKKQGRNVYLCPANCTFLKPLEKQEKRAVIFANNSWIYKNDYRGGKAYNNKGLLIIDYIGDLKDDDKLLSDEQIEGLNNRTLIWKDGQIIPKPKPTIQEQIDLLENQQTSRLLRNASLGEEYAVNKLKEIEDKISTLREQLSQQKKLKV